MNDQFRAVLWDFGGVFTTSPFEAFNRFERENNLPENFLRGVNATNARDNAWAQFERAAIRAAEFNDLFAEESAALGHKVAGADVIQLLRGSLRPEMVAALKQCKALSLKTGCITNNVQSKQNEKTQSPMENELSQIMALFDVVLESSKIGIRKPDPKIYLMACDALEIDPAQAVYLDDLGVNLKPARALGMATIKVGTTAQALGALEEILEIQFS